MSTDLVAFSEPHAASDIVRWAEAAEAAHGLATALCRTAFVPDVFQLRGDDGDGQRIGNATAAILLGAARGLDPLSSLDAIYMVRGRPGWATRVKVALVKSRGHSIWTEEETDESCTVAGHRAGEPDHVERVTWNLDRARLAGFTRNSIYATNPRAMLYARAAGDVAARIAPDALLGISEEAEEPPARRSDTSGGGTSGTVSRRKVSGPPTVPNAELDPRQGGQHPAEPGEPQRAQGSPEPDLRPASEARVTPGRDPELDEPPVLPLAEWEQRIVEERLAPTPPPEPDEEPPEPLMTGPQRARLQAEFASKGIQRDERLRWISTFLGREITSASELTVTEARDVIDAIEAEPRRTDR